MTPLAQVWHVFVKDVRQQRWPLLLYTLLVVVATGHALDWRPVRDGVFAGTMMVIAIVVVLLIASVIQGDSPTRSDAFWASHPLDSSAVLAAKVLFAIAVLAVAAIGQEIAIHAYGATAADMGRLVIRPLLSLAAAILIATVVASLTRDLRTFMLTGILIPLLTALTFAVASAYLGPAFARWINGGIVDAAQWISLLLSALLVPWLYRTRDARWTTRLAGYVVAGIAVVTLVASDARNPLVREKPVPERPVPHFPLTLELPPAGDDRDPGRLTLALAMPTVPEQLQLGLRTPIATLRFRDGTSAQLPLGYDFAYMALGNGTTAPRPSIPGVRWLAGAVRPTIARTTLSGMLTPAQRQAIDAAGATVLVDATVAVDTIEAGEPMRLEAGSVWQRGGRRTTIERWSHYDAHPDVVVRMASVADEAMPFSFGPEREFALINRRRSEALPLTRVEMSQSMDGLVLPGPTIWASRSRLSGIARTPLDGELPGDEWYRDTELLPVIRRTLGSYPVKLTVTIPPR